MLQRHYPNPSIPLDHKDPYTLLIAVLLSAQCTDIIVNIVTKELFKKADSPEKMILLPLLQIENCIKSCGLFRKKAKAILALSHLLIDKFNGKVPKTMEDLESLPGVGHKTASVVLIQAFDTPAFPVDTHIHRAAKRWGLSDGSSVEKTERDLKQIFPENLWSKLHLQIIYYCREFCSAKNHSIENCEICKECNGTNKYK
jgi:endonuclease-3